MAAHTMQTGGRDAGGDWIRSIAIVGVVAIHSLDTVLSPSHYQAVALYFRWAVPAFIFLSAYYSAAGLHLAPQSFGRFCQRRWIKLIGPYLFYSTIVFIGFVPHPFQTETTKIITTHYAGYGWAGQYYFVVMLQLVPILFWMAAYDVSNRRMLCLTLLSLLLYSATSFYAHQNSLLSTLGDRPFIYWIPYVILGLYVQKNRDQIFNTLSMLSSRIWIGLLTILLPAAIVLYGPPVTGESEYIRPIILIVSMLLMPLAMFVTASLPNVKWISYLGQHSLVVFCLNPIFILIFRKHIDLSQFEIWEVPHAMLIVGAVVSASLMAGSLLKRIGLKALVM